MLVPRVGIKIRFDSVRVEQVPNHYTLYVRNPKFVNWRDTPKEPFYLEDENGKPIVDKFVEQYRVSTLYNKNIFLKSTKFEDLAKKHF